MTGLRVVVCDDHRMMREALAGYLQAQPGIAAVETAADVDGAVRHARAGADVLVLDLRLGDDELGLEALEALNNLGLAVPVLVLGLSSELDLTTRALTRGALGYCPKTASPRELYDAVLSVASGRAFIPDEVLEPLLAKLLEETRVAEQAQEVLASLTARELEVLRLLTHGLGRYEIARRLGVSGNTVRTHLRHVMEKLGVTSQLAAAARGRELFDLTRPDGGARAPRAHAVIDLDHPPGSRRADHH